MKLPYETQIIEKIRHHLLQRHQTISVAESVTAGHIQVALSQGANAMLYFQGGMTVYNIVQKSQQLFVNISEAVACNCVSEKLSAEMAENCCKKFQSDWALAITGYATPAPPFTDNGLFACFAIASEGETKILETITTSRTDAYEVQVDYCNQVLRAFEQLLASS